MPISVDSVLSDQEEMLPRLGVLVYAGREGTIATIHKIEPDPRGKAPKKNLTQNLMMMPGENLSYDQLHQFVSQLAKREATRQILPGNVLVADDDLVVWHRPARPRVMFFETGTSLDELNGRMVLHPALLFLAKPNALQIFALDTNERPDAKTPLFNAPYLNVYAMGQMCQGSTRMPDKPNPSGKSIKAYEKAFFDSSFAHTGRGDRELTAYPMGHSGLWRMLAAADHTFFPNWTLLRAKMGTIDLTLQMAVEARKR